MSIFDTSNPPISPDSDLDPDLTQEAPYDVQGGSVNIAPGDWVDADPGVIAADPVWGYSFQVSNMYYQAVGILVNNGDDTYSESQLSQASITNNFRRMPKT